MLTLSEQLIIIKRACSVDLLSVTLLFYDQFECGGFLKGRAVVVGMNSMQVEDVTLRGA
jgi:hypothetical protein